MKTRSDQNPTLFSFSVVIQASDTTHVRFILVLFFTSDDTSYIFVSRQLVVISLFILYGNFLTVPVELKQPEEYEPVALAKL